MLQPGKWAQGLEPADKCTSHAVLHCNPLVDVVRTHLAMLQAHDLLDGLYLCIGCNLGSTGIPNVQQLAPEAQPSEVNSGAMHMREEVLADKPEKQPFAHMHCMPLFRAGCRHAALPGRLYLLCCVLLVQAQV